MSAENPEKTAVGISENSPVFQEIKNNLANPNTLTEAVKVVKLLYIVPVFVLNYLIITNSANAYNNSHSIDSGMYSYTFYEKKADKSVDKESEGHIVIKTTRTEQIIYEETLGITPGCDSYKTIDKLVMPSKNIFMIDSPQSNTETIVSICGSYSGRHQTIKLFRENNGNISTLSIDFNDSIPNINIDYNNNISTFTVMVRNLFKSDGGDVYYPFVYSINMDRVSFGVSQIYGEKSPYYYDFFKRIINSNRDIRRDIGPLIGALYATNNQELICDGIKRLLGAGIDMEIINYFGNMLVMVGYPSFKTSSCKE